MSPWRPAHLHGAHVEAAQEERDGDDKVEGRLEQVRRGPEKQKSAR